MTKRLTKSATDRKISGVCGGIAEYFNADPTIVRLIWAAFTIFGGSGIILYILAAIFMPEPVHYDSPPSDWDGSHHNN